MTTIAYRDGVLAADMLSTSHGARDAFGPKIWRCGGVLIGAAGSRALCLKFRSWVIAGMSGESPWEGKDDGLGIIVSRAGIVCWGHLGPWPVREPFYTLGSGYQFATGAMEMGASASAGRFPASGSQDQGS